MTMARRVGILLTAMLLLTNPSSAQNTRNVLVLHTGASNYPANQIFSRVFREVVGSDLQTQIFDEYIDEYRLGQADERVAAALQRYADERIDLVVADGWLALTFVLKHGRRLWPATPMLFDFVHESELPEPMPANMTGVTSHIEYGSTLELALKLLPDTRHVFYVGGSSFRDQRWRSFAEQDFKRFTDKVDFTYLTDLPLPQLLDSLERLPDHSIVMYAGILQDVKGQAYVPARICPLITSASAVPVFGVFNTWMGCGIVGGSLNDFESIARQSAVLAQRVLERGTALGVPVEASASRTVVDWRQLQRWQISEDRLPANTTIRFRTPTIWQRYHWYVVGAAAVLIIQLVVIVVLGIEMRKRKKSEMAVSDLSGRLISAGEQERKRIARELHDDISQRLSVLSLELAAMEMDAMMKEARRDRVAREPLQQLNQIIADVHNLSRELHSDRLQFIGLTAALKELCEHLSAHHGVTIQLHSDEIDLALEQDIALCFYRVAQEALNNSVKHSGSARIEVRLTVADGMLAMSVRDFGIGFVTGARTYGLGLATMRERLRLVHGELVVHSRPGAGTEIRAKAKIESPVRIPV